MFSRVKSLPGEKSVPVVWIAEVMETETLKPIDKVFRGKIHESPGRNNSERDMASKLCIPESRAILQMAKAAWMDEIWLIRPLISAGWEAAAR
jgi:hypothetical protein